MSRTIVLNIFSPDPIKPKVDAGWGKLNGVIDHMTSDINVAFDKVKAM
jgi:hypothetical protein